METVRQRVEGECLVGELLSGSSRQFQGRRPGLEAEWKRSEGGSLGYRPNLLLGVF